MYLDSGIATIRNELKARDSILSSNKFNA